VTKLAQKIGGRRTNGAMWLRLKEQQRRPVNTHCPVL